MAAEDEQNLELASLELATVARGLGILDTIKTEMSRTEMGEYEGKQISEIPDDVAALEFLNWAWDHANQLAKKQNATEVEKERTGLLYSFIEKLLPYAGPTILKEKASYLYQCADDKQWPIAQAIFSAKGLTTEVIGGFFGGLSFCAEDQKKPITMAIESIVKSREIQLYPYQKKLLLGAKRKYVFEKTDFSGVSFGRPEVP